MAKPKIFAISPLKNSVSNPVQDCWTLRNFINRQDIRVSSLKSFAHYNLCSLAMPPVETPRNNLVSTVTNFRYIKSDYFFVWDVSNH